MKKLILMVILTNAYLAAQVVTAVAPLKPGNRWVYLSYVIDYSHPETYQYLVTDSIKVINGILFYATRVGRNLDYISYFGITPGQFFARYDTIFSDSLYIYFKLNPQKGNMWENDGIHNTVIDTFTTKVFNKYTLIYAIDREAGLASSREYWTKEFGMLDGLYEQAEDILKGCVIDGVLYGDTTITGIVEVKNLPDKFVLFQNYPNPFNPSTVISWYMEKGDLVTLKIYDVLGREVETLIDNKYYNSGIHKIAFNAKGLSSGVYIYRLVTKEFVQSKKMILIR